MQSQTLQIIILALPCLLLCVTIHEFAHALVAKIGGDRTAEMHGRLTLNPVPHIDPIGTLLMPILSIVVAGIPLLCWAKPVPVNPLNYRKPSWDLAVSLAGPASNFTLFLLVAILMKILSVIGMLDFMGNSGIRFLFLMLHMNMVMTVFNLLPIPPLDGSALLYNAFVRGNYELEKMWFGFYRYSFLVLFLLIQIPFFQTILRTLYGVPVQLALAWIR